MKLSIFLPICFSVTLMYIWCVAADVTATEPDPELRPPFSPIADSTCGEKGNVIFSCLYAEAYYALISVVCKQFKLVEDVSATIGCALDSLAAVSGVFNGLSSGATKAFNVCGSRIDYLGDVIEARCAVIFPLLNGVLTDVTELLGSVSGIVNNVLGGILGGVAPSSEQTNLECGSPDDNFVACIYLLLFNVQAKLYCTVNRAGMNITQAVSCLNLGEPIGASASGVNIGTLMVEPICAGVENNWDYWIKELCPGLVSAGDNLYNNLLDQVSLFE